MVKLILVVDLIDSSKPTSSDAYCLERLQEKALPESNPHNLAADPSMKLHMKSYAVVRRI